MIVALLGASGAIVGCYGRDLARARDAAGRSSVIIDTGAGPIEYAERGEGRPLLSIHGAGGGFDQGLANAAELVGDGFRVIAPSRFGYLRTPVPSDASPAAQADAHAALLSSRGIHRAIVLGVSAGARSAVELALRRPDLVERLLLIVPALHDAGHPPATDASRGSQFAFSLVNAGADFAWWIAEKLAPSMLVRFIGVPPALLAGAPAGERDRVMRIVRSIAPLSLRFPGINIDSAPCPTELPLERIAAPTLIISARDDLFATATAAEFAAGKIRDARLVLYDAGGHLLVGHSAEAQAAVRAFLDSPAATPRRVLSAAEG